MYIDLEKSLKQEASIESSPYRDIGLFTSLAERPQTE